MKILFVDGLGILFHLQAEILVVHVLSHVKIDKLQRNIRAIVNKGSDVREKVANKWAKRLTGMEKAKRAYLIDVVSKQNFKHGKIVTKKDLHRYILFFDQKAISV